MSTGEFFRLQHFEGKFDDFSVGNLKNHLPTLKGRSPWKRPVKVTLEETEIGEELED